MTADGNWNLVVSTPMGERRATLSLKADGGTLTGSQMADGSTAEILTALSMVTSYLGRYRFPTRCR